MKYQSLKGMKDILPAESAVWQNVETRIRETLERFGYEEIRTPVLEQAELFIKGSGETTDIVGKEMYTLTDKGENVLALKPEMTPAVVRAYLQHGLGNESPLAKFYYLSPMFRQERPQAGRLRQFHQFGVEAIGSVSPRVDVETIAAAIQVYKTFGLDQFIVKINSIGCPVCRPKYREILRNELLKIADQLSPESKQRLETNPLRVLDSKDERDREATKNAPLILDHLCPECAEHFKEVKKYLDLLHITYEVDGRIVRGLDYYTKTVYEFISTDLGSQDALGGGGRYDLLVEQMGGKPTPAVGFAAGIERLLIVLEKKNLLPHVQKELALYIAATGDAAHERAFGLAMELRAQGIYTECDLTDRSVKAQMREANKRAAQFTIVLGDDELQSGKAQLKRMADGTQQEIALDVVAAAITKQ